jgi:hypothetical protein
MNPSPSTATSAPAFLTAADVARRVSRHPNTVKELAAQLRLELAHTANGTRLFSEADAAKIAAEIQRREQEALRR